MENTGIQWNIGLRPKTLDDVYGCDHLKAYLRNSVLTNSKPTAMLFYGKTGTGKTTVAQIAAKMFVCKHLDENGNPCNECESCTTVDKRIFNRDVVLIDAGTDSSRKDLNEALEKAIKTSQYGREKVIIIDEAQNLKDSKNSDAQSLLYNILESPKPGLHFILTAMAPISNKALKDRLQQFSFTSQYNADVAKYLLETFEKTTDTDGKTLLDKLGEHFDSMDEVNAWLQYVAGCSEGSLRAAINLAERCFKTNCFDPKKMASAFGVTSEVDVLDIMYAVSNDDRSPEVFKMISNFMARDARAADASLLSAFQYMSFVIANAECMSVFGLLPTDCDSAWMQARVEAITKGKNYPLLREKILELGQRPYLNPSLVVAELLSIYRSSKPAARPTAPGRPQ